MDDDAMDPSVELSALRQQRFQLRQAQVMMAGEEDTRVCRDMFPPCLRLLVQINDLMCFFVFRFVFFFVQPTCG